MGKLSVLVHFNYSLVLIYFRFQFELPRPVSESLKEKNMIRIKVCVENNDRGVLVLLRENHGPRLGP